MSVCVCVPLATATAHTPNKSPIVLIVKFHQQIKILILTTSTYTSIKIDLIGNTHLKQTKNRTNGQF